MKHSWKIAPFVAVLALTLLATSGLSQTKVKKITIEEARKTALAAENGKIKSEELEKEKGKQIYSFDIEMPNGVHEVNIDAMTGKLVEDTIENAQDEAKEAAEDAAKKAKKSNKKPTEKKAPATTNRRERPIVAMDFTSHSEPV
jgi:Skp family chaperone for outer membrane proteins